MRNFNPYKQDKSDWNEYRIESMYNSWWDMRENVEFAYSERQDLGICPVPEHPEMFRNLSREEQMLAIDKLYNDAGESDRILSNILYEAVVFLCEEGYEDIKNYWCVKEYFYDQFNDLNDFCVGMYP